MIPFKNFLKDSVDIKPELADLDSTTISINHKI